MRKVLIYDAEKMRRAGQLFNKLTFSGTNNIRMAAELSYILDSGEPAEMEEKETKAANPEITRRDIK